MSWVDITGGELYYEETGSGQPIVLSHGSLGHHRTFQHQYEALSDDYRVIRYDLRGHGKTGATDTGEYSVDLFADDLRRLLTELDLDSPVLVGHSLGGLVSLSYAFRHDVSGLVLIGSPPPSMERALDDRSAELARLTGEMMPLLAEEVGFVEMVELTYPIGNAVEDGMTGEVDEWIRLLETGDVPGMIGDEIEKAAEPAPDPDIDFGAFDVPTLALFGEDEVNQFQPAIETFESELPNVVVESVPDAGHLSITQNPDFVTDQILGFLEANKP